MLWTLKGLLNSCPFPVAVDGLKKAVSVLDQGAILSTFEDSSACQAMKLLLHVCMLHVCRAGVPVTGTG